jgi:threonylcarbamoyladenosine tRNA methylthiotransferase MtaB
MKVYFSNLGCKLNQAEVDRMARLFLAAGHRMAGRLEECELHVINSCTGTHVAARASRKIARRGGRLGRGIRTVLTGCYATGAPQEAAALAGVDLVVSNEHKDELLERVHAAFPDIVPEKAAPEEAAEAVPVPYVPIDFGHARALVKIEDGCNMRCSFCIIPFIRGRQRSRPVAEVVAEVAALAAGGYPEVVVTGVQISEYEDDGERLYDLVAAILAETDVARLRLTSIAPWKFDSRLLDLWSDPRLCRHLHMSLQSGSSATLKRMRRPYSAPQFANLVQEIRAAIDGVAITTDVIVGFPGETEEEFGESLEFVARMGFARPHVFTYSQRQGTLANSMPEQVEAAVKKERVGRMLTVSRASERAFWRQCLGHKARVVWEEKKGELWSGLTDNYVRVFSHSEQDLAGRSGEVEMLRLLDAGVAGRICC